MIHEGTRRYAKKAFERGCHEKLDILYVKHKIDYAVHKRREATIEMAIAVNLDLMLLKRKMTLTELSGRIGISVTNLSLLKTGKVRGMRFVTLDAICRELRCQPGDLLEHVHEPDDERERAGR